MHHRHLAIAPLLLTLALGACGRGNGTEPASAPTTEPVTSAVTAAAPTTVAVPVAGAAAPSRAPVRTDDLEAELRAVDQELGGAEQSVNHANDTSPDRADD